MKLLHCADIHLGYETHGRLDPATGLNTRLVDFKRCLDVMVARAVQEDVDLFLFCGDAYRTADPTPTQQQLLADGLAPLATAGIPIAMIVGNHDHPVSFGKASAVDIFQHLSGRVQVFRRIASVQIETKSGPLQLIAMPWPIRSVLLSREQYRKKTALEIRETIETMYDAFVKQAAAELDPSLPAVVAGHFSVEGAELGGSERTSLIAHEPKFTVAQLAQPGVDYVALGHIHKFQDRNEDNYKAGIGPPVVYSSSIERISFKEADSRKGFVLIDITAQPDGSKKTTYEYVDTPARRFVAIECDAREAVDPTQAILAAIDKHDVADSVVRVRYRVTEAQAPLVDSRTIRAALDAAHAVAAIERTVDAVERQRRTVVRRETTLGDAMRHYVAQKEELAPLADRLVEAALEIEQELEGGASAE